MRPLLTSRLITNATDIWNLGEKWDDLWQRSEVTSPTSKLEHARHFYETFLAGDSLAAILVESGDQFVAGVILCRSGQRFGRPVYQLLNNRWSDSSEMLLDPSYDLRVLCDLLVAELTSLDGSMMALNNVRGCEPRWRSFIKGLELAECYCRLSSVEKTGMIPCGDWQDYQKKLSKNRRKALSRRNRKLQELGETRIEVLTPQADQVQQLLDQGFRIENKSWKGREGSATNQDPKVYDYYLAQAQKMAAEGSLRIAFLWVAEVPIAFEYGWISKGIYHSLRTGYDEAYKTYGPGLLLFYKVLEAFAREGTSFRGADYLGLTSAAMDSFQPQHIELHNYFVATKAQTSRCLATYDWMKNLIKKEKSSTRISTQGSVL